MTIKIVTDSTCDLPKNVIEALGITVVPLFINLFDKGYLDGVEITRQDFYTNLPNYSVHPTTSIPGLNAFTQVYKELASKGAKEILSIHISESLSGTVGVAQTAAREYDQIPVTVRDSGQLSLGTGFQVETAARMANEGKSIDEILAVGDQSFQDKCIERLHRLNRAGTTIVFVSHNPVTVLSLCERALWIEHGRLVADGPAPKGTNRWTGRKQTRKPCKSDLDRPDMLPHALPCRNCR